MLQTELSSECTIWILKTLQFNLHYLFILMKYKIYVRECFIVFLVESPCASERPSHNFKIKKTANLEACFRTIYWPKMKYYCMLFQQLKNNLAICFKVYVVLILMPILITNMILYTCNKPITLTF